MWTALRGALRKIFGFTWDFVPTGLTPLNIPYHLRTVKVAKFGFSPDLVGSLWKGPWLKLSIEKLSGIMSTNMNDIEGTN